MKQDYLAQIQQTIDYIEAHISEELSLSRLAQVAKLSDFHFHRVFQSMAGETVMEYVRKRRLAISAYQVANSDAKLIDIALDTGFQNHETFTRAFKRMFEMTPAEYRKREIKPPAYSRLNVLQRKYNPYLGGIRMEYKIITKPAFKVIGYEIRTRANGDNHKEIPAFWQEYIQKELYKNIPNRVHKESPVELGICYNFDMGSDSFSYLIGMEAESFDGVEGEGLVCREFDGAEYAVFTTPKVPREQFSSSIQNTWMTVFGEWFPHSGYEHAGTPEFELYDERSNHELSEIQMDIYIPIKKKA